MYKIQFFLGGDLKFLAIVCGIEAANADHACVWYNCPKSKRSDMKEQWCNITDQGKGLELLRRYQKVKTWQKK